MYRNKRMRIITSLLLTIFVVFASQMIFQNLSIGGTHPDPDPFNENGEVDNQPIDLNNGSDNEEVPEDIGPKLTNNQRYFEKLASPDSTNILVTGSDPSSWNFDTIMIISIDKASKTTKLISLPRDIYIDYSDFILEELQEKKPSYLQEKGMHRINAVPSIGNAISYKKGVGRFGKPYIDFLCDVVEEVFDIPINDYVYVRVDGVRKIVDYFGGVKVYVPTLMNYYDPTQNLDIYIEPGTRTLYGKDAEGYLRFRQGYDANGEFHNYGDFFRKENQSRFVKAFITQHVTISNLTKLSKISEIITQNVITSVKGWNEIVEYGALAEEALNNNYQIMNVEIKCNEKNIDGSSYVLLQQDNEG